MLAVIEAEAGPASTPEITDALLVELARLKAQRDSAWQAFNPKRPPGRNKDGQLNDWPRFAEANSRWWNYHISLFGKDPEPDQVEEISSRWYRWWRFEKKPGEDFPPERVWKYIPQEQEQA